MSEREALRDFAGNEIDEAAMLQAIASIDWSSAVSGEAEPEG